MEITLVGASTDFEFSPSHTIDYGRDKFEEPPSTDLIDNHGNISGDYYDVGCFDYFDAGFTSGTFDSGYGSWMAGAEYYHTYYGTVTNMHEWTIAGNGVSTEGLSFDIWTDNVSLHVDYTRAFNTSDGSETWVAKYNYGGQNAGSVVTTFTGNVGNIYAINADGDVMVHKTFQN